MNFTLVYFFKLYFKLTIRIKRKKRKKDFYYCKTTNLVEKQMRQIDNFICVR